MAWSTASIKLEAAQTIFTGAAIAPIDIGGKTVGYRAQFQGQSIESASLTALCAELWGRANTSKATQRP
jgi:hypothetical protein